MIILVTLVILIVVIIYVINWEPKEHFLKSTYIEQCPSDAYKKVETTNALDTDYLKILKGEEFNSAPKYMLVSDFVQMVTIIRRMVLDMIIDFGTKCQTADGNTVRDRIEPHQKSLSCYDDIVDIEERIILKITGYIYSYIKERFNINLNPYLSVNLMKIHLNLLESVLYPLAYSTLYTEHGIQYFNESLVKDKVYNNLQINDVLFTILSSRGIILVENVDNTV